MAAGKIILKTLLRSDNDDGNENGQKGKRFQTNNSVRADRARLRRENT